MTTPHRAIAVVLVSCLVTAPCAGTLFAAEEERPNSSASDITSVTSPESIARMMALRETGDAAGNTPRGLSVPMWQDTSTTELPQRNAFAGQVYREPPIRIDRRNSGSIAALVFGSIATITGGALLIYANRPDCSTNQYAGGCGYGTKVVGGAVLTGGVVGLMIGALTWR